MTMRKNLLLLLSFLSVMTSASAQITITSADMPSAGDEALRTVAVNPLMLNYQATGANHTWNFANLRYQTQQTDSFYSVSSTNFLFALFFSNLPFNPNRANVATAGTPFPSNPLITITDPYNFYYRSSNAYEQVGLGASIAGIPTPVAFSQKDKIYQFPLQYGDVDTSISAWSAGLPGVAYYGFNQTRVNQVDGWGQLTTPFATYSVLRVKTTLIASDTVFVDSLGFGTAINRPLSREYKWLANGDIVPVLQVNTTEIFGLEVITAIFFRDVAPAVQPGILPLELCAGADYLIPYSEVGTFNPSAFLTPGNRFTAQLSDASGDFTNPVNIGDTVYHQSGAFTVSIPANIPSGNGYRIRLTSTSPATTGIDNGVDIRIVNGVPAVPVIAALGNTSICQGDSVELSEVNPGIGNYQWMLNGQAISGANVNTVYASLAGTYELISSNACGSVVSNSIVTSNLAQPQPSIINTVSTSICSGDSVLLTGSDPGGVQFQWLLDGNLIAGANDSIIYATQGGQYALNTSNVCGVVSSNIVSIQQDSIPAAGSVSASGSLVFCAGDSVVLTGTSSGNVQYQWYLNGIAVNGANSLQHTAVLSGNYELEASNGCGAALSNALQVTVNVLPSVPVITQSNDTLFTDPGYAYTWYYNSVQVNGVNDPYLVISANGNYLVVVTNVNGCTNSSAPFPVTNTGLDEYHNSFQGAVYPNPGAGQFEYASAASGMATFSLYSADGRLLWTDEIWHNSRSQINFKNMPEEGVYLLQVLINGKTDNKRLVIRY